MKQRTRVSHSDDDLIPNMNGYTDEPTSKSEIQLYRIKPQEHFIEAQVQEGDTLQAIALRFYCSISELKRINQIHKDNEIFARRTIKVPVTPYSVLTELIPPHQTPVQPTTSNESGTSHNLLDYSIPNNTNLPTHLSQNNELNDFAVDCNAVVLNSSVAPAVLPYTDEQSDLANEDTQLLPNKEKISVEAVVVKELTSHGADFGLKWFHLVCFVVLLGVIAPLIYVLFYLDKHKPTEIYEHAINHGDSQAQIHMHR